MASMLSRLRNSALARMIDRAAGVPLLWLLGAVRRKRPFPPDVRSVGILVFETIGDTLLASTVVASLRARDPQVRVVVFASRGNAGILALIEGIDEVVEVPLTRPLRALAAVRREPVDVAIDIGQWPRWYALMCALSRSRYTVGFATPGQARHFAYDCAVVHRDDVHELENFGQLLAPFPGAPRVAPAAALKPVGTLPASVAASRPYVVIHPWASGFRFEAREWPADRWVELARRVAGLGRTVLVSGGPADRERAAKLVAACDGLPVRSIAGDGSFSDLAAILRHADAVVAVNTGTMHLASLLGVPLVALHGPTNRRRWGPTGARSIALAPPAGAQAEFLNLGFEYPGGSVDCMSRIGIDEVFAALQTHLKVA